MAALFFAEMRFDPKDPKNPESDRFVLSKGHAAPILYAAWAEAGAFDRAELMKLREIGSDLEGHPTPRLPFVDVATGSLGQGICAAIGTALNARRIKSDYRTYVLLGDGESAEGSVWEAADVAAMDKLDNLCGITDVNALGQSRADDVASTTWGSSSAAGSAFGWHAIVDRRPRPRRRSSTRSTKRDGTKGQPTMILARTIKGKGVSFVEGKDGWHGKAFKKGEELDRALAELEKQFVPVPDAGPAANLAAQIPKPASKPRRRRRPKPIAPPAYKLGDQVATREALRHRARQARRSRPARRRARRRRQELDVQRRVREGRAGPLLSELHRRAGDGRRGDGAGGARRDSVSVDLRVLPDRAPPISSAWRRSATSASSSPDRTPACRSARTGRRRWRSRIWRCTAPSRTITVLYPSRRGQRRAAGRADGVPPGPGVHADEPSEDAGDLRATTSTFTIGGLKVLRESAERRRDGRSAPA